MSIHETTRAQRRILSEIRDFPGLGLGRVVLQYDDRRVNGHKTFFSITVLGHGFGGPMHDEIREVFPEFANLIKWHLVSADGPMHYMDNTLFHARKDKGRGLVYARNAAVAPRARLEQLQDPVWLKKRLPRLLSNFRKAMADTFPELEEKAT